MKKTVSILESRSGFTFIELLLTIVILAILLACVLASY